MFVSSLFFLGISRVALQAFFSFYLYIPCTYNTGFLVQVVVLVLVWFWFVWWSGWSGWFID